MSDMTVSFFVAQELKQAGWNTPTFLWWVEEVTKLENGNLFTHLPVIRLNPSLRNVDKSTPAPTLEEILRALPTSPKGIDPSKATLVLEKDGIMYATNYQLSSWWGSSFIPKKADETLADAAATLWIKMKKEDLL